MFRIDDLKETIRNLKRIMTSRSVRTQVMASGHFQRCHSGKTLQSLIRSSKGNSPTISETNVPNHTFPYHWYGTIKGTFCVPWCPILSAKGRFSFQPTSGHLASDQIGHLV